MSVVSPAGQEGGRGSTSGQEDSGRIILPFWVSPPCLLSVRCFFFFLTEEGLEPAFPSIPLRTARSHEALWLALASTLLPSCNHSGQLGSSESLGKWQWLGWTVARGSPGLRTQAPSVRRQLGCLRRLDRPRQGGTAGISYCPSLRASSTVGTSCRLPRKSSSQAWPSTSSRRLAVDAAAPSD